ncbi:hypothetical protein G5B47_15275 [Paenibacillus sp. 7124]|uniref:DUF3221 domain-containing protein n=2 Tax=Paenibacillus TaxID=44249 RepID=A0A6M1PNE9_9BACL|nr:MULTISPECIES: hypothetical protein [Paenibacillus]AHV98796.1 hypothetical protein PSAB_19515 [Paenibacillus sabinae T27]NGM83782.1 hypothetical protein [Paenibacillus apii]
MKKIIMISYILTTMLVVLTLSACSNDKKLNLSSNTAKEVEQIGNIISVERYENVKAIYKNEIDDDFILITIDGQDKTLGMKGDFDLKEYVEGEPIKISYEITTKQVVDGFIKRPYITRIDKN